MRVPFTRDVREEALVLAARHCCVCHRYRGVHIEVHHIKPEEEGGPSDLDNAIVLCFDCHSEAGHYNPRHPRGTKFSRPELKKHRDRWHEIVLQNQIPSPAEAISLLTRYLVCKDMRVLGDICAGQFNEIPVTTPRTVPNAVLAFHNHVLRGSAEKNRPLTVYGPAFRSKEEIIASRGCTILWDSQDIFSQSFAAVWQPTAEDVDSVASQDTLTRCLLYEQVSANELFSAGAEWNECAGGYVGATYRLRPIWTVYLAVTNMDERLLTLQSVTGSTFQPDGYAYRPYSGRSTERATATIPLPAAALPKGATAVIPIATVLGPLEGDLLSRTEVWSREEKHGADGAIRTFEHADLSPLAGMVHLIGPHLLPKYLECALGGDMVRQDLHELDLTNLYCLDRYWMGGSCPFLFWLDRNHGVKCAGELFDGDPGVLRTLSVRIPADASTAIIAELEHEVTTLHYVAVDGVIRLRHLGLAEGQWVDLSVSSGKRLEICGSYLPLYPQAGTTDPWVKIIGVRAFIRRQSQAPPKEVRACRRAIGARE